MTATDNVDGDKARRFGDAALPHLDDVFTLARYLMRNAADAEDAVQECYLRALRHFDSYRGPTSALPQPFRETIVLREINALSYREIADIVGAPVGTVMSRLARARAMLRTAWNAEDGS